MILNLPAEIILTISNYLALQDKVDLAVTCRKLHNLISKTNLYQELDLFRYQNSTSNIVNKFETHQLDGTQVKTLKIYFQYLSKQQSRQISHIFPNVTRCKYDRRYNRKDGSDLLAQWKDTLEQCSFREETCLSLIKMGSPIFPQLTELNLGLSRSNNDENKGFNPTRFLSITKSTPLLKKLCLKKCDINLEFLDGLHANCLHLQSLILKEAMIIIDNEYLPESIIPASSVLKLEVDDKSIVLDTRVAYLDYIVKKYVNLQSLSLSIYMDDDAVTHFNSMIGTYFSEIDPFEMVFGRYTETDAKAINTKISSLRAEFKSTVQVYRTSGHEFLSNLPKSLKRIKLNAGIFSHVIQPLSLSESNIVILDVMKHGESSQGIFQEPNDYAYLQKLPHLKLLNISLCPQVQQYDQIVASTSITKLYIHMTEGTLYLSWILERFSSLEELYINAKDCQVKKPGDGETSKQGAHLKLQYLKVESDNIQQELITFVKKEAPNLKNLQLVFCGLKNYDTINIDLTNWELNKCSLSFDDDSSKTKYVICNITIYKMTRRLVFHRSFDSYVLLPDDYKPRYASDTTKYSARVNVTCSAIQHLKIANFTVGKENSLNIN